MITDIEWEYLEDMKEEPITWLIPKFIEEKQITLLHGLGGSSKSLFSTYMANCLAEGKDFMGFKPLRKVKVLYVDFERQRNSFIVRSRSLARKMGFVGEKKSICYAKLKKHEEFGKIVEQIGELIKLVGAEVVFIDTVSQSFDGDLEKNADARRYFNELSVLNTTIVLLAHQAKNAKKGSPYGSVFFQNNVRVMWGLAKEGEKGASSFNVNFINDKATNDGLSEDLVAVVTFDGDKIEIKSSYREKLETRILAILPVGQPMTVKDMASLTLSQADTVRTTLHRMRKLGVVIEDKASHKWKRTA